MSKVPAYVAAGFRPNGPGRCQCARCGAVVSTNAYARTQHSCATVIEKRYREAYEKARETNSIPDSIRIAASRARISVEQAKAIHAGHALQLEAKR